MIPRLSSRIVNVFIRNHIIEEAEAEIYQYGLEMVLSTAVNILIVLCCGLVFGELISAVLFFIMFAWIRSSSGGYHAETYLKCNTIYTINLVIVLFWVKFAASYYSLSGHIMFLLIYFLTTAQFAPVENPNKPLEESQKKKHKLLCILYGVILSIVSFALWYGVHQVKYAVLITATMLSVAVAMAVEIFRNGGERNEEDGTQGDGKGKQGNGC